MKNISINAINIDSNEFNSGSITSYDETINALKEIAFSYYMRGYRLQYNTKKRFNEKLPAEQATTQNTGYLVCSGFVCNVYNELLGIHLPRLFSDMIQYTKNNINQDSNGNYKRYKKDSNNNYVEDSSGEYYGSHKEVVACTINQKLVIFKNGYSTSSGTATPSFTNDILKNIRVGDGLKIQRYIAAKNNAEVAAQHPDWLNI